MTFLYNDTPVIFNIILQDVIVYEVVGDFSAPSYFDVDFDGRVRVRESLLGDRALRYRVSYFSYNHCALVVRASAQCLRGQVSLKLGCLA